MFTVSLIGPDGVGKTTIAKLLEKSYPRPLKYLYMGGNAEASNYMLPTTRWWENRKRKQNTPAIATSNTQVSQPAQKSGKPKWLTLTTRFIRKSLGFTNRILEEWYRQFIAFSFLRRGYIVVFDRHFIYDYYHDNVLPDENQQSIKRKLHGLLLKHTLVEPDLVICLDAPGEVVFNRKGEFTPEFLEIRRNQYLSLETNIRNFAVVNANRDLKLVVQDVTDCIDDLYRKTVNENNQRAR